MSTNTEHADDWDAQREALSAYLDGRLAPEEDAALRTHLETCSRCAHELAELRQLVALLGALPRPALPRSFAVQVPVRTAAATVSRPARATAGARPTSAWPRVAQWAGGLVAAAGLVLGIVGALGHVPLATYGSATRAASSALAPQGTAHNALPAASAAAGHATTPAQSANGGPFAASKTATPAMTLVPTSTPALSQSQPVPEQYATPAQGVPDLPIAGAALLVVGATTFAAGTRSRRRQR